MSTTNRKPSRTYLFAAIAAFGVVQLIFQLLGGLFETWNSQVFDRFFLFRSSIAALKPPYDGTVVHIDLNDTAIQQLKTYYLTRSQYAQLIRNLAAMRVAAQAYDLIFAAGTSQADDQAIIAATREAGNVYFGMAIELGSQSGALPGRIAPEVREYLDHTKWAVKVEGQSEDLYSGTKPLITFPPLAEVSRGIGFLSLKTDRDGVIRRVPLLVAMRRRVLSKSAVPPRLRLPRGWAGKNYRKAGQLHPDQGRKAPRRPAPATFSSRSTAMAR